MAERQEEEQKQQVQANEKIAAMFDAVINSPTEVSKINESKALKEYAQQEKHHLDMVSKCIIDMKSHEDILIDSKKKSLQFIYETVNPVAEYKKFFDENNNQDKAFACRQIADFGAKEEIENIAKYLDSKSSDLSYNAAMSLTVLGDGESVIKYIKKCQNNHKFSHRIIIELIKRFTGDREKLADDLLRDGNDDYIKATVIKAIVAYKYESFEDVFMDGLESSDINLKIACVKALSQIGKPSYEHTLTVLLHDKNWIVRASAIKGLENIKTESAIKAIFGATKDDEWWVRQAAAKSLVNADSELKYVESTLQGYDKYAIDAVKYSLYRYIDIKEDQE